MKNRFFSYYPLVATLFLVTGCDYSFQSKPFQPEGLKLEQKPKAELTSFNATQIPQKLSEWSLLYLTQGQLKLHSDAVPYHLNTPLFSDYAHKFRSLWIPEQSKIKVLVNGDLEFPIGSVLSKTFYYPRKDFNKQKLIALQNDTAHSQGRSIDLAQNQLIETRLLIKQLDGWQALPYVWNKQQTEAILEITGSSQLISLNGEQTQEFTYMVPDANQCKGCHVTNHTSGELKPIGPKIRHLDLAYEYRPDFSQNQLIYWQQQGLIDMLPLSNNVSSFDWRNRNANLAEAARSYLDINCAHCHNPDGPADTSALYLNKQNLTKAHLGICKTPVAAGKGTGNRAYDITPGKADQSIMVFRMESNDPSIAMPELGRSVIHEEGVELIKQWINQMDGACTIPAA
ncbi:SO2930 family diheme c-type cytochrome [Kangiella sp. TOML190]|uniref:SO2930 family diheme c-type cytochrome n=1 Tax=Kangiella sp. TOML190 TaxID=2931351 RepID=UPI00203F624B|nr:SO2930 family diheme c-type cytochrome [Kangiella sp. TOML190]